MPATTAPAASANAPALDPALCGSSRVSESQGGSVFPSILATNYQPSAAEQPGLCLSFEDVDQLPKAAQDLIMKEFRPDQVRFSSWTQEPVPVYVAPAGRVRFTILGDPDRSWVCEKGDDGIAAYRRLAKGDKLGGQLKSSARLWVVMLLDDKLVSDEQGVPVVFCLALKSNRVPLIGQKEPGKNDNSASFDHGVKYNGGWKTVAALNAALIAHYEPQLGGAKYPRGARLTQQVSVEIVPIPERFGAGREVSWGVRFTLGARLEDGAWHENAVARPLARSQQEVLRALEVSPWFQNIQSDPFGVKSGGRLKPQFGPTVEDSRADNDEGFIPF
jgi:hypothetical protein